MSVQEAESWERVAPEGPRSAENQKQSRLKHAINHLKNPKPTHVSYTTRAVLTHGCISGVCRKLNNRKIERGVQQLKATVRLRVLDLPNSQSNRLKELPMIYVDARRSPRRTASEVSSL